MCLVHEQSVNAQLLEGHNIIFPVSCPEFFQPGFQTTLGALQLLDGELFTTVVLHLLDAHGDIRDLVFTRQTHTSIVRVVDDTNRGEGLFREVEPECDALVTNTPGVALAAFTADCTPILLWDPVTGAVGAVHAGWRGTVADIAGNAVRAMAEHFGSRPEDIRAAIGPNIAQCCFETHADVPEAVRAVLGEAAEEFIVASGEKFRVDLKGVNAALLRRCGVREIELSCDCTACRSDRFWSHRRVGNDRGSLAAIIVREGERTK